MFPGSGILLISPNNVECSNYEGVMEHHISDLLLLSGLHHADYFQSIIIMVVHSEQDAMGSSDY